MQNPDWRTKEAREERQQVKKWEHERNMETLVVWDEKDDVL